MPTARAQDAVVVLWDMAAYGNDGIIQDAFHGQMDPILAHQRDLPNLERAMKRVMPGVELVFVHHSGHDSPESLAAKVKQSLANYTSLKALVVSTFDIWSEEGRGAELTQKGKAIREVLLPKMTGETSIVRYQSKVHGSSTAALEAPSVAIAKDFGIKNGAIAFLDSRIR